MQISGMPLSEVCDLPYALLVSVRLFVFFLEALNKTLHCCQALTEMMCLYSGMLLLHSDAMQAALCS